jgi:B12-binding domain/radical SAM domain protein
MELRVLALAAPQFADDPGFSRALNSEDPASLFNACRLAARLAEQGEGPWGDSNWAASRCARRDAVLLLRSFGGEVSRLQHRLETLRPHLLLIGSMSICLPGAVACARLARQCLGDRVCVVLGGRHPTETIYLHKDRVTHHSGSPLRLMAEGAIPEVFDVVVAGDGEHLVAALGEVVARTVAHGGAASRAAEDLASLSQVPGRWIIGTCRGGHVETAVGRGPSLPYAEMLPPCALFGVRARFNVFGGRPTAHVFSDVGGGCIFDCTFCSERRLAMGPLRDPEASADRLAEQVAAAARVIAEDYPGQGASAFVEDSTFLSYVPRLVERFVARMASARLDMRLGGQLTIDQVLARPPMLRALRSVGLEYLFVGLETFSPAEVGGMSKDVRRNRGGWIARAEEAFTRLREAGIRGGVAVLFGLGESHASRLALIEQMRLWRRAFGMPYPISMNWAVQHPLFGHDGGSGYTYTDWALPGPEFVDAFRDFGEASWRYPLAGVPRPCLAEVIEIRDAVTDLLDQDA